VEGDEERPQDIPWVAIRRPAFIVEDSVQLAKLFRGMERRRIPDIRQARHERERQLPAAPADPA
jgi:hypothetical protein